MIQKYLFQIDNPPVLYLEDGTEIQGTYQHFIELGHEVSVNPKSGFFEVTVEYNVRT